MSLGHDPLKLSVILPVHNEARYVEKVLNLILSVELPDKMGLEIIAINDGSTDDTGDILERLAGTMPLTVHHFEKNRGKTAATRWGIEQAAGDIILIQDGDLEYDPNDYPRLLEPIIKGRTQVVYGSRFLGQIKQMRVPNLLGNKLLNLLTNLLFGTHITDVATCYKVFSAPMLKSIPITTERFEFCPEVTAKLLKRGYKIIEVPISYKGRSFEEGKKIHWPDAITAIWSLFKFRFKD